MILVQFPLKLMLDTIHLIERFDPCATSLKNQINSSYTSNVEFIAVRMFWVAVCFTGASTLLAFHRTKRWKFSVERPPIYKTKDREECECEEEGEELVRRNGQNV